MRKPIFLTGIGNLAIMNTVIVTKVLQKVKKRLYAQSKRMIYHEEMEGSVPSGRLQRYAGNSDAGTGKGNKHI